MNPREFINTIYLGDRFCKSILIDGYNERVKIQINTISRIRSESGNWEYYNDENIEDGLIVFTGVKSILLEPQGFIPNDEIEIVSAELIEDDEESFIFNISAASCDQQGRCTRVEMKIIAEAIHLEDPTNQGVEINE
ncbi:DUF6258 family protein [Clostridium sp. Marseille-Q7071]